MNFLEACHAIQNYGGEVSMTEKFVGDKRLYKVFYRNLLFFSGQQDICKFVAAEEAERVSSLY